MLPGSQLIGHDAQREDISRLRHRITARLLRGHVGEGAKHCARRRLARQGGGLRIRSSYRYQSREPEVEYFHVPVIAHHDVLGLDVAMCDACGMRSGEGFSDLS